MINYSDLLYKRGFLLTDISKLNFYDKDSQQIILKWKKAAIGPYFLYYDPCLDFGYAQSNSQIIILLGLTINPFDLKSNSQDIAKKLLKHKTYSEDYFLDYLDQLSGRFVVIANHKTKTEIFPDACATRTIFYDIKSKNIMVSSHSALIANLQNYQVSYEAEYFLYNPNYEKDYMKHLPGLTSPFIEIIPLTANTKLCLNNRKVIRFFPRENNRVTKEYSNLEKEVSELMVSQALLLNKKSKIAMSLTAGLDSRLSLASTRNVSNNIEYFTYVTENQVLKEDLKTAKDITTYFNLKHKVYGGGDYKLKYSNNDDYNEFNRVWEKNLGMNKGVRWLSRIYVESFPQNTVHLRSNLSEIARCAYCKKKRLDLSSSCLAYLYTVTPMQIDEKVISKFAKFIEITGFTKRNLYNYDFYDMFYWEHNLPLWHGWLLLENDLSHDTFSFYNNRKILSKMLSLPYEDRLNDRIYIGMIKRLWPELLKFPVNKKYIL